MTPWPPEDAGEGRGRPRRPASRPGATADVLVVLGWYLVAGAVAGVLWWLLVEPASYLKVESGASMPEAQMGRRFDADGWYAVIASVAGLLSGVLLTWWRSRDYLLVTVLLVAGSAVAAAAMATVGLLLGPPDPAAALEAARPGEVVPLRLEVAAEAAYLMWPIASLVGALTVLWSSTPENE